MNKIFKFLGLTSLLMIFMACSQEKQQSEMANLDFSNMELNLDLNLDKDQHEDIPVGADEKIFISEKLGELKDLIASDLDQYTKQIDAKISFGKGKYSVTEINIWENNQTATTKFNEENLLATCHSEECVDKTITSILEKFNPIETTSITIFLKRGEALKIYAAD